MKKGLLDKEPLVVRHAAEEEDETASALDIGSTSSSVHKVDTPFLDDFTAAIQTIRWVRVLRFSMNSRTVFKCLSLL